MKNNIKFDLTLKSVINVTDKIENITQKYINDNKIVFKTILALLFSYFEYSKTKNNKIKFKQYLLNGSNFKADGNLLKDLSINDLDIVCNLMLTINKNELIKYIPLIFEELLFLFSNRMWKQSDFNILPKEIVKLMSTLVELPKNAKVYNPFAGLSSFATCFPENTKLFGQELDEYNVAISKYRLLANNRDNAIITQGDSIKNWNPNNIKYDLIISSPPTELNLEDFIIKSSLKYLKKDGKLIIIVPLNYLSSTKKLKDAISELLLLIFRQYEKDLNELALIHPNVEETEGVAILRNMNNDFLNNLKSNFEAKLQSKLDEVLGLNRLLLDEDLIETIIELPSVLPNTTMQTAIIVINRDKKYNDKITMINASKHLLSNSKILDIDKTLNTLRTEFSNDKIQIENNEVSENELNLIPSFYFSNYQNYTSFTEITSQIEFDFLESDATHIIKLKDLKDDFLDYIINLESLDVVDGIERAYPILNESCLLLSINGKIAWFNYTGIPIYYKNDSIFPFKINTELIDVDYLIGELQKGYVKRQLLIKPEFTFKDLDNDLNTGVNKVLEFNFSLQLAKINIPDIETQRKNILTDKSIYISKQLAVLKEAKTSQSHENSVLRHQIAGRLRNLRGSFNQLNKIFHEQLFISHPEVKDLKSNPKRKRTLNNYLETIDRDLKLITNTVSDSVKAINLEITKIENLDLIKFIQDYVTEIEDSETKLFDIDLNIDEALIQTNNIKAIFIKGDENNLRTLFDNIITNAEKHAFNNRISAHNRIEILLVYNLDERTVQINFSNTGLPMPKDYTLADFVRKGSKIGKNKGNGYGGWLMNEIMKKHNGKLNYTNKRNLNLNYIPLIGGVIAKIMEERQIVTTIELTFPININYKK